MLLLCMRMWSVAEMFCAFHSWGLWPCKHRGWLLQVLQRTAHVKVMHPIHISYLGIVPLTSQGVLPRYRP